MNLLCPNKCAYKMTTYFFWYDHICKLRNNLRNAHTHICVLLLLEKRNHNSK